MKKYRFRDMLHIKDAASLFALVAQSPEFFDLIPDKIKDEEFLVKCISTHSFLFAKIHHSFRSKKLCDTAFGLDIQLLSFIPEEFITEEMAYKASLLNGNLLSKINNRDLFSGRVIQSLIKSNHYDLVPAELQNKNDIVESFRRNGALPSRDFWSVKPYVDAICHILINRDTFTQHPKGLKNVQNWELFLDSGLDKMNPIDYALQTLSDDFATTEHRALSFIFLKLNEPITAAKFLKYDSVRDFIIPYHGETVLAEHADRQSRRHLIESSFGL